MKPTLSRILILIFLIAFLTFSFAAPTDAQTPEPQVILNEGEFPVDINNIQPSVSNRSEITVNGDENSVNVVATWWSTSGTTFVPSSSTITYNYGGEGCVDTGGNSDVWRGNVNLPNGSTIVGMFFNYDNDVEDPINSEIYLRRYRFDGTFDNIIRVDGIGNGIGNLFSYGSAIGNAIVDNEEYAYVLVWVGNPDQNLCSVNLSYTPPPLYLNALPLINR